MAPCSGDLWVGPAAAGFFAEGQIKCSPVGGDKEQRSPTKKVQVQVDLFFIISFLIFFVLFKKKKIEMLQMVNCLTILNSRRYRTRLMSELTSCRRGAGDGVTGGTDNAC